LNNDGKYPVIRVFLPADINDRRVNKVTSSISSIPIIIPNAYALKQSGAKLAYPIRPDQIMVAQFRHIITYPSEDGAGSSSVFKLRILDGLIEQLAGEAGRAADYLRISGENIDSLIAKLKNEVEAKKALKSASFGGTFAGRGIILDLFA
jgi:hypothetical protein